MIIPLSTKHIDLFKSYIKGLAVIITFLLVGFYIRVPLRGYLKTIVGGVPYWLDHIIFMLLADLLMAIILGWFLLGRKGFCLALPTRSKAWSIGILGGAGTFGIITLVLFAMGQLKFGLQVNWLLAFGNLFSNFYEEFIFRVVLINLLKKYFCSNWFSIVIAAGIFSAGHLNYPLPLLGVVFGFAIFLGCLVVRFKSIYPAWISHVISDFLADTLFVM